MTEAQRVRERLEGTGQEHLIAALEQLANTPEAQNQFCAQLDAVLPDRGAVLYYNQCFQHSLGVLQRGVSSAVRRIEPPAPTDIAKLDPGHQNPRDARYFERGCRVISEGRGAIVILAGGSGTRLGVKCPKGMYRCPHLRFPVSLFQLHCERAIGAQKLAENPKSRIPIGIMTSEDTHKETVEYFKSHNYFGLPSSQISFFQQSSVPCYTLDGRIILRTPAQLATAPGGNGGVYAALVASGVLDAWKRAGVCYVQIFSVDNLLAKIADPLFFGFADLEKADVVVKATPKINDHERVGVFAKRDGLWGVVEYSEIGSELAEKRDPVTQQRMYDCANIAIHLVNMEFLDRIGGMVSREMLSLANRNNASVSMFHAARKPIQTTVMGDGGENGKSDVCTGIKLEAFIFDVFSTARNFKIVEVMRNKEFAPIKNADDPAGAAVPDSPLSAARLLHALHRSWLLRFAESLPALERLSPELRVEISPLVSFDGEGLEQFGKPFQKFVARLLDSRTTRIEDAAFVIHGDASVEQDPPESAAKF